MKKPTTKAANDEDEEGEGQDEDHAEEKEEETQEEDAQKGQEETSTHAKGRKKGTVATAAAGQFSLGHAQKASKAAMMKRPAAVGSKDRQTKNSESKEKKGQNQKNTEKEETPNMGTADGGVADDENSTQETRAKRRNRLTSNAYHTTLDAHKPKKKDGYVPNSQEWDAKMEKAKELARGAHGAAGRKFDEENPKEGEEVPAREEKAKPKEKTQEVAQQKQGEGGSNAKKTKKKGEDEKTWTRPRNVD